jgi:hypothetical protein
MQGGGSVRGVSTVGVLLYPDGTSWHALPEWASFFREVGRLCASHRSESQRLIAGALVPTRAFAAGFVALGAVEQRLTLAPSQVSAAEHFATLTALPIGSTVTVQQAGKKYLAKLTRLETGNGNDGIWVRYEKDGVENFLPVGECHRVTISNLGKDTLAKRPTIANTANHGWDPAFVQSALGVEDATQFARQDDFAALIIGKLSNLRFELEEVEFGIERRPGVLTGHIEDLIRTKKFADDPAGETFRTEVLSDRARDLDPDVAALDPPVVVFDGARAFEKHYWNWPNASWVVILDQSDPATDDGAAILNTLYAQRDSDVDPIAAIEVPPGVEFISFLVRKS